MAKRNNNSRKSLAIALGIVGVAGLSMASAAQLTVNNDDLAAGVDVVGTCDTAVDVSFTTSYNATVGAYIVSSVTVSDIAAGCDTATMDITLIDDSDGSSLFSGNATLDASGSEAFAVGGTVLAEDVDSVAVVIH